MIKTKNILLSALLLPFVFACSHPIEHHGKGEGDVFSQSGTRDCTLEDWQAQANSCTKNWVVYAYDETYTALGRPGSQFHRWHKYCKTSGANTCRFNFTEEEVKSAWNRTMPPLQAIFRPTVNTGFKAVFMGHSFFDPFASMIEGFAHTAGFTDHDTTKFLGEGEQGAPRAFWQSAQKGAIQAALDAGDVDLVGMTYFPTYPEINGYRSWVRYALEANPDTRFFIGLPWVYNPETMTLANYEVAYNEFHDTVPHQLVDALRAEFPNVDFYAIPYGQAALELWKLWDDGTLLANGDVATLTGGPTDSIFTDSLGHPGDILEELGTLIWLGAIYDVDLTSFSYSSSFTTDLRPIAQAILDGHDPNYNAPPEIYPDTDGIPPADRYDDDDDNDGILDVDDDCPLDPDPFCGAAPITNEVYSDGLLWAQVADFVGLSWDEINAVCPAGVCDGALNGYDLTGWTWASVEQMNDLFNLVIGSPVLGPGPSHFSESMRGWASNAIGLNPTYNFANFNTIQRRFDGWTSDAAVDGTETAYWARMSYGWWYNPSGPSSSSSSALTDILSSKNESVVDRGAWFFRPAPLDYDRDGDGLPDVDDLCPDEGPNEDGFGCPILVIEGGDIVNVDGTEWAQPDLFLGLSWDEINAVCPSGVCGSSGTLNGYGLVGWTWASVTDVNDLFNFYIQPDGPIGPGPDAYVCAHSGGASCPVMDAWRANGWRITSADGVSEYWRGLTNTPGSVSGQSSIAFVRHVLADGQDVFATSNEVPQGSSDPAVGAMFFRNAP